MKLSVKNFGPIKEAMNIEVSPMTIFVGPSNTGKSYLATLIYALFDSFDTEDFFVERFYKHMEKRVDIDTASIDDNADSWLTKLSEGKIENAKFSDLPEDFQKWINEEIAGAASSIFHQKISRCMGISQKESPLISNNFNLELEDKQTKLTLGACDATPNMEIKEWDFFERNLAEMRRYIMTLPKTMKFPKKIKAEMFISQLSENMFYPYGEKEAFYLPAARTGIMQSHLAIAGALVKRAPSAGREPVSVATLSGIVSDFLEYIILMDTDKTPDSDVGKIADELEEKILRGSIRSKSSEESQYPQFSYKQNDIEVPLLRSSSMVAELAPIVLFLRHRVRKGDLLIIEEPEAHLHPADQLEISDTLVQLVNAGVRVLITTHSDNILERISNSIHAADLPGSEGTKLDKEKCSVYLFDKPAEPTVGNTTVNKIPFDPETGLLTQDHLDVSSALYNETVNLMEQRDNARS